MQVAAAIALPQTVTVPSPTNRAPGYTTGRTAECGNGSRVICAVAARVPVARRAWGSESIDVGWHKTATVYCVPTSLTGREA